MTHEENGKKRRIPLAERLQLFQGRYSFPRAIGLYDADFFNTVGSLTGDPEKYAKIYDTYIREYGSTSEARVDVIDLIKKAQQLDDEALENILYWTLVEPFAAIKQSEKNQNQERTE